MEHESDGYINWNWFVRYSHEGIDEETGGLRNKRASGDRPNYCNINIGQNAKKNPGD